MLIILYRGEIRLKIVFVIHGLRAGGAEKVLTMLVNYLVTVGFDVYVLVFSKKEPFYDLHPSVKIKKIVHELKSKSIFSKVIFVFKRINLLRDEFRLIDPDVVVSFLTEMNIYSTIAAILAHQKIILSEHTNFKRHENKIIGKIRRIVYPYANSVVVLTNYDKKKYKFLKSVHVIKNPLVLINKHSNIEREKIILGVGRLVHVKGFDMLIKAFSMLKTNEWKLIILGEGPARTDLEKLIRKLNLENRIIMSGTTKDVEMYYKKASIFVLSSRTEGFPGVLCEAMGYGCPSIAYDCLTGPRDIIDNNKNGLLVEANNVEKLSCEINDLMFNMKKRKYLSYNAMDITKELDINKIGAAWIKILNNYRKDN